MEKGRIVRNFKDEYRLGYRFAVVFFSDDGAASIVLARDDRPKTRDLYAEFVRLTGNEFDATFPIAEPGEVILPPCADEEAGQPGR